MFNYFPSSSCNALPSIVKTRSETSMAFSLARLFKAVSISFGMRNDTLTRSPDMNGRLGIPNFADLEVLTGIVIYKHLFVVLFNGNIVWTLSYRPAKLILLSKSVEREESYEGLNHSYALGRRTQGSRTLSSRRHIRHSIYKTLQYPINSFNVRKDTT